MLYVIIYAICYMLCIIYHRVSCITYFVSRIIDYVLCVLYHVSCIMYHALCLIYYVSCIMYDVLCILHYSQTAWAEWGSDGLLGHVVEVSWKVPQATFMRRLVTWWHRPSLLCDRFGRRSSNINTAVFATNKLSFCANLSPGRSAGRSPHLLAKVLHHQPLAYVLIT